MRLKLWTLLFLVTVSFASRSWCGYTELYLDVSGSMVYRNDSNQSAGYPNRRIDQAYSIMSHLMRIWPSDVELEVVFWGNSVTVVRFESAHERAEYFTKNVAGKLQGETKLGNAFAKQAHTFCTHYVVVTDEFPDDAYASSAPNFSVELERLLKNSFVTIFVTPSLLQSDVVGNYRKMYDHVGEVPQYRVEGLDKNPLLAAQQIYDKVLSVDASLPCNVGM